MTLTWRHIQFILLNMPPLLLDIQGKKCDSSPDGVKYNSYLNLNESHICVNVKVVHTNSLHDYFAISLYSIKISVFQDIEADTSLGPCMTLN